MGVHIVASTIGGGVTPICNECGISLCWDISEGDYLDRKTFWDGWTCRDCKEHSLDAQEGRT